VPREFLQATPKLLHLNMTTRGPMAAAIIEFITAKPEQLHGLSIGDVGLDDNMITAIEGMSSLRILEIDSSIVRLCLVSEMIRTLIVAPVGCLGNV
jgi:hypothetical protein